MLCCDVGSVLAVRLADAMGTKRVVGQLIHKRGTFGKETHRCVIAVPPTCCMLYLVVQAD